MFNTYSHSIKCLRKNISSIFTSHRAMLHNYSEYGRYLEYIFSVYIYQSINQIRLFSKIVQALLLRISFSLNVTWFHL